MRSVNWCQTDFGYFDRLKTVKQWPIVVLLTLILCACNDSPSRGVSTPPRVLSNNANLESLDLAGVELEQVFQPIQTGYTASVGFLIASVRLNLQAEDPGASIRVNDAVAGSSTSVNVTLAEGSNVLRIQVTSEDNMRTIDYSLTITRETATQFAHTAYVKASNTDAEDLFGSSIALHGDTLAVGAVRESSSATGINGDQSDNNADRSGAVYILTRDGAGVWSQQAYLKAPNTDVNDEFGHALALLGDTLVVGAPSEDSMVTGIDGNQSDNTAVDAGAVYVFTRDISGSWSQHSYIKASNTESGDRFGSSLALEENVLVVGAPREDSAATGFNGNQNDDDAIDAGAVYVFTRDSGGAWSQEAYIKASNSDPGDRFGSSVALAANTLAVGSRWESSAATGVGGDQSDNGADASGAAYVFVRDTNGSWSQQAYVKASNTGRGDQFGHSVALSGNSLAVGAPGEASTAIGVNSDQGDNGGPLTGAVYLFTRDEAGAWSQQAYIKPSKLDADHEFGRSVAISGDTLVVGGPNEDGSGVGTNADQSAFVAMFSGAVYVFTRDEFGDWSQENYIKATNTDPFDAFGVELALDGETLVVGSGEASSSTGVGGDQSDNSRTRAGAVYVIE